MNKLRAVGVSDEIVSSLDPRDGGNISSDGQVLFLNEERQKRKDVSGCPLHQNSTSGARDALVGVASKAYTKNIIKGSMLTFAVDMTARKKDDQIATSEYKVLGFGEKVEIQHKLEHSRRLYSCIMTKLTEEQQAQFDAIAAPYLASPQVKHMRAYVQHGNVSTYAHCMRVAYTAYDWTQRLGLQVDYHVLVAGALLHDFYLYDWHDGSTSKPRHATQHPLYAARNAVEAFSVSPKVASVIRTHMWPLPPTRIPQYREAWMVCLADKWCALAETLSPRVIRHADRKAAVSREKSPC